MTAVLFYDDTPAWVGARALRRAARREVESSTLIVRAAKGDRGAAVALHIGFWPFVSEFELAIDQQKLPRFPLRDKFGDRATNTFLSLAEAVREMKREEGSHAAHWRKDAECLGVLDLEGPIIPGVQALVEDAYSTDLPRFFSVLAGTEYIAEELSKFLVHSPAYTGLFSRHRWVWGEVHTIPHDDGPSHLEIDIDLARAYAPNDRCIERIREMILDTIRLFGQAAREVEAAFAPVPHAAAE